MTVRTKYVSKPLNINPNFNPFNYYTKPPKPDGSIQWNPYNPGWENYNPNNPFNSNNIIDKERNENNNNNNINQFTFIFIKTFFCHVQIKSKSLMQRVHLLQVVQGTG
jgi:hypothetical protein